MNLDSSDESDVSRAAMNSENVEGLLPPVAARGATDVAPAGGDVQGIPEQARSSEVPTADFLMAMLAALGRMALRSSRRQADVQSALRSARMTITPAQMFAGLQHLCQRGSLATMIELGDGGILVTVTADGFDRLNQSSYGATLHQS